MISKSKLNSAAAASAKSLQSRPTLYDPIDAVTFKFGNNVNYPKQSSRNT